MSFIRRVIRSAPFSMQCKVANHKYKNVVQNVQLKYNSISLIILCGKFFINQLKLLILCHVGCWFNLYSLFHQVIITFAACNYLVIFFVGCKTNILKIRENNSFAKTIAQNWSSSRSSKNENS